MERAHPTVVGTFHYGQRQNYVRPIDDRIKMDIIIAVGDEIIPEKSDAENSLKVDRVIGQEASRRPWEDLEGLVVDCEITSWPTASKNPRGRLVEVIGYEDDFGVDVEIIVRKHHLPHHFPQSVIAEAREISSEILPTEQRRRCDFR
jgi:ribonuclease R